MYSINLANSSTASVFFVFENSKDLKSAIRKLPKVGVGYEYGLPQTRLGVLML